MHTQVAPGSEKLGTLYAASFLANFDRMVILPLLLPAAASLRAGLGTVTLALTAYLLLFGVMQPVYGILSDLLGRIRVMRMALLGLCVADLIAAFAPNAAVLVAGRALAGACAAALMPVVIAYVGDRVPFERRQRTVATVLSVAAVGVAVATVVAGVLTHLLSWRAPIALAALGAPVIALLLRRQPEGVRRTANGARLPSRFASVFGRGWFRFLLVLALFEGAAMQGFFNFFAPALQAHGNSIVTTGLVTASYGLAVILGSRLIRRAGMSAAVMFGVGGGLLCAGYLTAAPAQTVTTILAASVLAGLAYALVQSTVQTWATEVAAPAVRGLATSLVACAVFTGAAAGSAVVGGLAAARLYTPLFLIAAILTVPVAVVGAIGRARFEPTQQAQPAPKRALPAAPGFDARQLHGVPTQPAVPTRTCVEPTIFGQITGPTDVPLPTATVTVITESGTQVDRIRPDPQGWYRCALPACDTYLLLCAAGAHQPAATRVRVAAGPVRHDIVLLANGSPDAAPSATMPVRFPAEGR